MPVLAFGAVGLVAARGAAVSSKNQREAAQAAAAAKKKKEAQAKTIPVDGVELKQLIEAFYDLCFDDVSP